MILISDDPPKSRLPGENVIIQMWDSHPKIKRLLLKNILLLISYTWCTMHVRFYPPVLTSVTSSMSTVSAFICFTLLTFPSSVPFHSVSLSHFTGYTALLNPLNTKLNPICHLLALLGAQHIFHVSIVRVNTKHWIFRLALTAFCLMILLL